MKDEITVAIVCAFFIGMVWISSTSMITFSNDPIISEKNIFMPAEDITMDFIDYKNPETTLFDETKLHTEISAINTNGLTFSEAFGYYRQ